MATSVDAAVSDAVTAHFGQHQLFDVAGGRRELVTGHGGDDHQVLQIEVATGWFV